MTNSSNTTFTVSNDGFSFKAERFAPVAGDLRYIGHGRLERMGAVGLAEIARREQVVMDGLARIAARRAAA